MADDQDPSGLVEGARTIYKKANDWLNKVPTPGYKPPSDKVDTSWHDEKVGEANKSFIHPTATMAQKKTAPPASGKTPVSKPSPRKRY